MIKLKWWSCTVHTTFRAQNHLSDAAYFLDLKRYWSTLNSWLATILVLIYLKTTNRSSQNIIGWYGHDDVISSEWRYMSYISYHIGKCVSDVMAWSSLIMWWWCVLVTEIVQFYHIRLVSSHWFLQIKHTSQQLSKPI